MKVHLYVAAILVLICSGCVPYYYNDPYYHPYGYGYHTYPYRPPVVYIDPGVRFYAPLPYFGFGYYGYRSYHGGRRH